MSSAVRRGRSLQAAAVAGYLRASRSRRDLGRRLAGDLTATSAEPGETVRRVAGVTSYPLHGGRVWRLMPLRYAEGEAPPLVVYLHGGAFVNGFSPYHWRFLADLVRRTGAEVLAPEYPLTPAATVADTLPWSLSAYAAPAASARTAGRRVVLMGDSAGANLALTTALAARDAGETVPDSVVLLSPWLDVAGGSPGGIELDAFDVMLDREAGLSAGRLYAGERGVADPTVSPIHADLTGLPEVVAWCGDRDQVVADQRLLASRAAEHGWPVTVHEAPGMVHCYMLVGFVPEARTASEQIADLVGRPSVRRAARS